MSALKSVTHQPIEAAGFRRMQNTVGTMFNIVDCVALNAPNIAAHIRLKSSDRKVETLSLMVESRTWAETNLDRTIVVGSKPSPAELAAAEAALDRLRNRTNEDIDAWALALGEKFGSYGD